MADTKTKLFTVDKTTMKQAPAKGQDAKLKRIKEIQADKTLDESVKALAIEGLKSQMEAAAKPFKLSVVRGGLDKNGKRVPDLLNVEGSGFKTKMLSPRLLEAIIDNGGFILAYIKDDFHAE